MNPFAKTLTLAACALAASLMISACGGGASTDVTKPTVNITSSADAAGAVTFTFTFSEAIRSFNAENVTVNGGTPGAFVHSATDTNVYTLTVTPTTTDPVTVALGAGIVSDMAGNTIAAVPATVGSFVPTTATLTDWPKVTSSIKVDPTMEAKIASIVAGMSVPEKVGQMVQAETISATPDEVKQYFIGSVLSGGDTWPKTTDLNAKHASAADWVALADQYWDASKATRAGIPVMWGIDAVHGNNKVYGATIFPHNIGLGAANDSALIGRIGAATATQVAATGLDWTFGPTLAVARDDRWGRTYESFSEDPAIVSNYAQAMVTGLQANFARTDGTPTVIATAKHFIGDGGTDLGTNEGVNKSNLSDMINIHGRGYYSAIGAGVQTVMVSFSSWNDTNLGIDYGKMHGSKAMITNVLKQKMGFDGLVISDWNGIAQVPDCTPGKCAQAVNAGIDMFMVPSRSDWKAFITNTIAQVNDGTIPVSRINDAVTRILRVKMRSGLYDAKKPSLRVDAGDSTKLQQRSLAREAVQKSLVLLKNNNQVLPLKRGEKILVVGKSADSIRNQTGGWTLTWQGTGNTNADFPNADSILAGIKAATGADNVVFNATATGVDVSQYKAVIAVIGETPYAETFGDLKDGDHTTKTLELARNYPEDLKVLDAVSGKNVPVITVLVAGRPLLVNKELNRSDAFVVAWLPGTEGAGVADVLFRNASGGVNVAVTGKLSFSWPKSACQSPLNKGDATYDPLFAYGYGLGFDDQKTWTKLDETAHDYDCGQSAPVNVATTTLGVWDVNGNNVAPYSLAVGSLQNNWKAVLVGAAPITDQLAVKVATDTINGHSAKKVTWTGVTVKGADYDQSYDSSDAQFYAEDYTNKTTADLLSYKANGALEFETVVHAAPAGAVTIAVHCTYPCRGEVDGTKLFNSLTLETPKTIKVPLACFTKSLDLKGAMDFTKVSTPFLVTTGKTFDASFANIRWVPNGATDPTDVVTLACDGTPSTTTGGTAQTLSVFNKTDQGTFVLAIGSATASVKSPISDNYWNDPIGTQSSMTTHDAITVETAQINVAGDAQKVTWKGGATGQFFSGVPDYKVNGVDLPLLDLSSYQTGDGALEFDTIVYAKPTGTVTARIDSTWPNVAKMVVTDLFSDLTLGTAYTIKVPLSCLVKNATGEDGKQNTFTYASIRTPFLLTSDYSFTASFGNIRWVSGAGVGVACPGVAVPLQ